MSAEGSEHTGDVSTDTESEIKHPLQSSWTLHISAPTSAKRTHSGASWQNQVKELYTFASVEDFWRLWNNITPGTELPYGSDYFLFREGIQPAWEDPQNLNGGRFLLALRPINNDKVEKAKVDKLWLWIVLALIGETIADSENIHGVSLSLRKQVTRIAVWTKNAQDKDKNLAIGVKLREILELAPATKLPYETHGASATVLFVA